MKHWDEPKTKQQALGDALWIVLYTFFAILLLSIILLGVRDLLVTE